MLLRVKLLMFAMTLSAFAQNAADYFPLEVGNRWEYQLDVSADRQIWQVARTESVKQNTWFLLDIETVRVDADGKRRRTGSTQRWVRIDGSRLMTRRTGDQENVWIDSAAAAGLPYPSPGMCHTKATNSPAANAFTVLYDRGCFDAGLLNETFVPHVGLQSFSIDSFVGLRSWRLVAGIVSGKNLAF
jgi:hypothetical protein